MLTLSRFLRLRRASRNANPSLPQRRPRLSLEALEDRYVLSTWLITSNADSAIPQLGTLRYAVKNAASGDTISLSPTLTSTPIALTQGELLINKNLTIQANANAHVTISSQASRVFDIQSGTVSISGLSIGGHVDDTAPGVPNAGGGILNLGTLVLSDDSLGGSTSELAGPNAYGGAIYSSGTLMIDNSSIGGKTIYGYGGSIYNSGTMTINNSKLAHGNGVVFGGAIANTGSATINSSSITGGGRCGPPSAQAPQAAAGCQPGVFFCPSLRPFESSIPDAGDEGINEQAHEGQGCDAKQDVKFVHGASLM
jgi:hypothetical protein